MPVKVNSIAEDLLNDSKLYDKIIKENAHKFSPEFTEKILGLNIVTRADLQESLQHTNEVVSDQMSKVTDDKGRTYILHIEWQSTDDPAMVNRMLGYRTMLRRKYNLPVRQYVVFLARPKSSMSYAIDEEHLKFQYHLIALQQYDYKIFLNSSIPEQKLMAIFGNFENRAPVEVIKDILLGIEKDADGELNAARYRQQLRGLVQLRKLTTHFKIAMGIVGTFKVEKDPFYQQGRREERAKAKKEKKEIALKLKMKGMLVEDISELTGLSIEQILSLD